MGVITFVNQTDAGKLFIDTTIPLNSQNSSTGQGRSAKWTFEHDETKKIDEGEIDPLTDKSLVDAVRAGQLGMTATDVDSAEGENIKQFLAGAVYSVYKIVGEAAGAVVKEAVGLNSTSDKVVFVTANGDKPFGVIQLAAAQNAQTRVKQEPFVLATCVASGAIAIGDKVIAKTDGKVSASSTKGLWQLGVAKSAAVNGADVSIQIEVKQIA